MPPNPHQDYAIVVGINKYPKHQDYADLHGATCDAQEFVNWLKSPTGGNIDDEDRIFWHGSDQSGTGPCLHHITESIDELMDLSDGGTSWLGRRLYIFLAGHGVVRRRGAPALLAADHCTYRPSDIEGAYVANLFSDRVIFDEVVLFMDCCQEFDENPGAGQPYVRRAHADADKVRQCFGFGTRFGKNSFERKFGGQYRGVFSWALMECLTSRAANEEGVVTAQRLETVVSQLVTRDFAQVPKFYTPDPNLVLAEGITPPLVPAEITLTRPDAGFEVYRGADMGTPVPVRREQLADDRWRIHVLPGLLYVITVPGTDDMEALKSAEGGAHVTL